jgi:hypothetical protein
MFKTGFFSTKCCPELNSAAKLTKSGNGGTMSKNNGVGLQASIREAQTAANPLTGR